MEDLYLIIKNADFITIISIIISYLAFTFSLIAYYFTKKNFKNSQNEINKNKSRMILESKIESLSNNLQYDKETFDSVNHMLNEAQKLRVNDGNSFLEELGLNNERENKNTIVQLYPFNNEGKRIAHLIQNKFSNKKFIFIDIDSINDRGMIFKQIVKSILNAEFVIANITGRNANVYYELGIAHALNKKVIIISKSPKDITFDISHNRVLTFTNDNNLLERLGSFFK